MRPHGDITLALIMIALFVYAAVILTRNVLRKGTQ
jgi:hypothetical protein